MASVPDRIGELAAVLSGIPWVLGGGLAIPFTLGEFQRTHDDVDLLFHDEHFPAIERAFARAGYSLWQRYPMSFFGAWPGALELRVTQASALARIRRRKLQFHPYESGVGSTRLPRSVDALPFRIRSGMLLTCDGRRRVPMTVPVVGHIARSAAGHAIPCLHLTYVAHLKANRREPKDLLDYARIKNVGLLPAGDWGV